MEPYPMRWFRFYDEALNDPKVQQLPDASFKYWVNLLCLANQSKPRGRFKRCDVAYALRITEDRAAKMLAFFIEKGLFDEDGDSLIPHGWDARQFQSDNITERVQKHRRNVSRNVPSALQETPPDTETDTETETENPPVVPPRGEPAKKRAKSLPDDWDEQQRFQGDDGLYAWARKEVGMSVEKVDLETDKFMDHFRGSGAVKVDWLAAWRNWMRRSQEFKNGGER